MKRINTSRQAIAATQRLSNYHPTNTIAPHVLNSTVSASNLTGLVVIRRAGRSFICGQLKVSKGQRIILVRSKFENRYYVCSNKQWSTNDQATIAKLRGIILQVAA